MAIVKSVRRAGRALGGVLDAEDRKILAQGIVLISGVAGIVVTAAGAVGLAWRVFWLAAGG